MWVMLLTACVAFSFSFQASARTTHQLHVHDCIDHLGVACQDLDL